MGQTLTPNNKNREYMKRERKQVCVACMLCVTLLEGSHYI